MPDLVSPKPKLLGTDILVVGVVRNERLRLPCFLNHHRRIGVDRFLLIDNDSDDGTAEFLTQQSDVTVYRTKESYAQSQCGVTWTNQILEEYAAGHWTLVLDADELFIFPDFETTHLKDLIAYLDDHQFEAVVAPMLDMYSDKPLAKTGYISGKELLEVCPYFDAEGYTFTNPSPPEPSVINRGGPRKRLFWDGLCRDHNSPILKKIPLMKWRNDLMLEASTHILEGAKTADISGLLLHFKFLQDFVEIALREAARKEHYMDARQYVAYADILSRDPEMNAIWSGSARYHNSGRLVDLGLMHVPDRYRFINRGGTG